MQNQNINEMINEKLGMGNENAFLTPHSSFLIKSRGLFVDTVIYVVTQGDTLCDLAKKFNTTVNMIARYNGIADTGLPEVDRVLRIPVTVVPDMKPYYEYTIKDGDTLFKLAEKFNTTVDDLVKLNGIEDPDEIWAGNILKIPVFPVTLPMPKPDNDNDDTIKYIVQEGDTLWKIAKRFNVSVADIINLNRLCNPDCIYPEQVITIPDNN